MTIRRTLPLIFSLFLFVSFGCSEADTFLTDEDIIVTNDNVHDENIGQNKWTYEQMSYHYFWKEDLPDSADLDFTIEPASFFEKLKSPKDRFSWCETNLNYSGGSSTSIGFGSQSVFLSSGKIVERVLYVTSCDLINQGLKRGDYISFDPESKIIQKYMYSGDTLVSVQTLYAQAEGTKSLNKTVSFDSVYEVGGKRIAYAKYDEFDDVSNVNSLIYKFKEFNPDDFIIDLRYNPGGYVNTCNKLASYIVDIQFLGKLFQIQRFNDNISQKQATPDNPEGYDFVYLESGEWYTKRSLNLSRLVVLTTKRTASACESLITCLRPYIDVITVGTTTRGKDVGSYTIADKNYKIQLQPITFRYYSADFDSTSVSGIEPDIMVEENLDYPIGDLNEPLLKAAIEYLTGDII